MPDSSPTSAHLPSHTASLAATPPAEGQERGEGATSGEFVPVGWFIIGPEGQVAGFRKNCPHDHPNKVIAYRQRPERQRVRSAAVERGLALLRRVDAERESLTGATTNGHSAGSGS